MFLSYTLLRTIFSIFGIGEPNNLPPGPTPLPVIGNLHLLNDQPHQSLAKLAKTHGPIMYLQLGRISSDVAKEVLQKQDLAFSTRHHPDALHAHNHAINSVVWMPVSTQWRTLRKILNSNMFSSSSLDSKQHLRNQKVHELVVYCEKASKSNNFVDIGRAAFRTSLNLISNTIFSKDLVDPYDDSGKEFKELVGIKLVEAGKPNLVDYFPVLRKMDPLGIKSRMTCHFEIFEELIKERLVMKKLKQDDVLDVFLKASEENPDEINRSHIKSMFLDLFVGGTDTTSNTVERAMAEVLRKPYIMTKVKEELEKVIGEGKIVEEKDLPKLPYLKCIVKETLRIHPPFPLLIPRKVDKQVKLNSYTVPKGTQVLINVWAIGRDPNIWEDSLDFKPEIFMNSGIDVQGQHFELIPFGAGRRICSGLPLAMRMIPMMLGSLLNMFDWNIDDESSEDLDMTERFGISLQKATPLRIVPKPL
nr:7-ethoxycoumarin O-deethylase-like [Tanacetum cinerariifolium]